VKAGCAHLNPRGTQCKRSAHAGSTFCARHAPRAALDGGKLDAELAELDVEIARDLARFDQPDFRVGSVCSGIAADALAVRHAGLPWQHAFFSEIAPFPAKVLAHHYPEVLNHGDCTTITAEAADGIALLVGGTPCQSFSVAGLRGGLDDERGALALEFLRLAARARPRWVVWENVPGVLSQDGGRAFGAFLGGLAELGYGWAYRILDAQFFGLAQRRRRVFVVACARGAWRRAAAVLVEPEGVRWDPQESAEEGEDSPDAVAGSSGSGGVVGTLGATGSGRGYRVGADEAAAGHVVAYALNAKSTGRFDASVETLIALATGVRRLTPTECERLMGVEDGYTAIPGARDGPRYAALGNSIAVPVLAWIFARIAKVDAITDDDLKGTDR
jgi:DNA (cytosine-5)-methyltransferase 1